MKRDWLYSIAITVIGALAAMAFKWGFSANERLILLDERLSRIQQADRDKEQDRQSGMQWKYLQWLHWQVDQLRYRQGMEPAQKPGLD